MIINLILLSSSLICLVFGIVKYLGKKVAMFGILIAAAIGCFMMGHLYDTITLLVLGYIPSHFNIGMLARIGGYAFFFSASYAQMDGLVDDGSRELNKYRIASLLAPMLIIALFVPISVSSIAISEKLVNGVVFLFAALSAYYNLKHLIIPDVTFGIISSIRMYSLFELFSAICYCVSVTAGKLGYLSLSNALLIIVAATYPCIMLFTERGRQKWIA